MFASLIVSFLASLVAEMLVTGLGSGYLNLRYLFGPLFLAQVVLAAFLVSLWRSFGARSAGLNQSWVALLAGFLIVIPMGSLLHGEFLTKPLGHRAGPVLGLEQLNLVPVERILRSHVGSKSPQLRLSSRALHALRHRLLLDRIVRRLLLCGATLQFARVGHPGARLNRS